LAGLSDMEELLFRIQNKATADYMREALACYNSGAYRACIVLSYIALFDDLRQKLSQLGVLSTVARDVSRQVEERAEEQQVFESFMIDKLKAASLITEPDAFRLDQIRQLRNKAAHPSGMHASPEEARYVYFETIDKFLSRAVLETTHAADGILERLSNENFFPLTTIDDITAIVTSEMESIHSMTTPYIIVKLVERAGDANTTLSLNAKRFLIGLASQNNLSINDELCARLITKKADDGNYGGLLMSLIAANPDLIKRVDSATLIRLRGIFEASVESNKHKITTGLGHPANLLPKLLDRLGEEYLLANFKKFSEQATEVFCYSIPLVRTVNKSPILHGKLKGVWLENAGSSNFDTANSFAKTVPSIDSFLPNMLESSTAFDLVINVIRAANWNAFESIALRDERFGSTPQLKLLAQQYAKENSTEAGQKTFSAFALDLPKFIEKYLGD
jgi:hypothetical protein